ncbi:hypothetical protein KC343_g4403 [Hortaea werneckii]|nr:hypothetical protein KC323_g8860 [Hortaea werneckii]KAI6856081.1 hypothetical protein KC338_g8575 [Hortaea werneckii]KAI7260753.1 hypothetical protein KC352_g10102 [Hortaea werneckii]KAI7344799.1 hypothetical protein KC320_g8648 [Hortaea werneckii]KAI7568170.1 hypothetical protein KC317_g4437 [Hortaea werneckii]
MPQISLYDASIPTFRNGMVALNDILAKACDHFGANSTEIAQATLISDLRPLAGHVQLCSNIAKKSLTRSAEIPTEVWRDDEETGEELVERCRRTIKLMDSVTPDQVNGHEADSVDFVLGPYRLAMTSKEYILRYGVPFFFFHLELVYSILRMKGVPLGFIDFLGPHIERFMVKKEENEKGLFFLKTHGSPTAH